MYIKYCLIKLFIWSNLMIKFNENAIREAAYYNWQNAGCPQGKDEYFWAMAVEQFNKKCSCGCTAKKSSSKPASKLAVKKVSSSKKKTTSKK